MVCAHHPPANLLNSNLALHDNKTELFYYINLQATLAHRSQNWGFCPCWLHTHKILSNLDIQLSPTWTTKCISGATTVKNHLCLIGYTGLLSHTEETNQSLSVSLSSFVDTGSISACLVRGVCACCASTCTSGVCGCVVCVLWVCGMCSVGMWCGCVVCVVCVVWVCGMCGMGVWYVWHGCVVCMAWVYACVCLPVLCRMWVHVYAH